MITLKIDVTKISKSRLFTGEKGTYLDAVLIETPNNQYGDDYMIVESVTKEEREQGVKGAILGNARILTKKGTQPVNDVAPTGNDSYNGDPSEIPF